MKTLQILISVSALCLSFVGNAQYGHTKYGLNALAYNQSSVTKENSAFGYYSLFYNTFGSFNTAMGASSLYNNTTGDYNTALGADALKANTTAYYNTAIGYHSLFSNKDQSYNTALGPNSLYTNTGGWSNTAIGYSVLYANTSGNSNTGMGHAALYLNTTGSANNAIGRYALYSNTTGSFNAAIGYNSLYNNTTGSFNTAIGYASDVTSNNVSNATAIGYNAKVDASNKVRIGSTSVTSIGGQVGWTTFSDGRYKKDIKENVPGLAFISSLRPITYTVNVKSLNEYYNKERKLNTNDEIAKSADAAVKAEMEKAEDAAGKIVYNGFIAQEVEEVAKKTELRV